jgi:hypothetical protein
MTVKERYEEWLRRANKIAEDLEIEINFTVEVRDYTPEACVDVCQKYTDCGFYSKPGNTYINCC